MSTSLYAITNSCLTGNEDQQHWDNMLEKIKTLSLANSFFVNAKGEMLESTMEWHYENEDYGDEPKSAGFFGPACFFPRFYSNLGIVSTIHNYSYLYVLYSKGYLVKFRNELYKVVQLMGGTEVIFLADNSCDKLSDYLEGLAWENVPYEETKQCIFQEMGPPVTDYSTLNYDELDYRNIKEFVFDDFSDLKV